MRLLLAIFLGLFSMLTHASNGFYTTLSNQLVQVQKLEVIANNAANANTIGFEEMDVVVQKYDVPESKGRDCAMPVISSTYTIDKEGPLQPTERELDIAIAGSKGYFQVNAPAGPRYTLNGRILISSEGVLINTHGYPFTDIDGAEIIVPLDTNDYEITKDGTIHADNEPIARIGVYDLPKYSLHQEGEGLLRASAAAIPLEDYTIVTGMLRGSNINSTKVMTDLIEAQRAASMTSSLLVEHNQLSRKAIETFKPN